MKSLKTSRAMSYARSEEILLGMTIPNVGPWGSDDDYLGIGAAG
jgi:hypothetical protein